MSLFPSMGYVFDNFVGSLENGVIMHRKWPRWMHSLYQHCEMTKCGERYMAYFYVVLKCKHLLGRNCKLMRSSTQRSVLTTASFISFISLLPRSYHKAFHHKLPGLQEHHDSLHISNTTRLANMGHSVMYTLFGSGSLVTVRRVVCLISLCCNYCFFIWQIL